MSICGYGYMVNNNNISCCILRLYHSLVSLGVAGSLWFHIWLLPGPTLATHVKKSYLIFFQFYRTQWKTLSVYIFVDSWKMLYMGKFLRFINHNNNTIMTYGSNIFLPIHWYTLYFIFYNAVFESKVEIKVLVLLPFTIVATGHELLKQFWPMIN